MNNPPVRSFVDGCQRLGYASVLVGVAFLRELFDPAGFSDMPWCRKHFIKPAT